MVWIKTVSESEARGELKELYDDMMRGSAHKFVPDSRKAFSLRPELLKAANGLGALVMGGKTSLGRFREELIALVVADRLACKL